MSDNDNAATAAQHEEVEAPEVERALGTGAREAVDGDLAKPYITDDVSPMATVAPVTVTEPVGPPPGEPAADLHEHEVETPAPSMGEAPNPA